MTIPSDNAQAGIEALFDRYLRVWNARDFDGIAACYTEPTTLVLPAGTYALADRTALIGVFRTVFERLESDDFDHTEIETVAVTPCGDGLAIVDARNVRRTRKDGSVMEVIDGHYVVRREDGGWAIAVAVSCTPGWAG